MKNYIFLAGILFSAGAFAIEPRVEPLMGFISAKEGLYLQVQSGGCTYEHSFFFNKKIVEGVAQLQVMRYQPDRCLARLTQGTILSFTYQELGLRPTERYMIANPILIHQTPD